MLDITRARDRRTLRRAVRVRCEAVADDGFRPIGRVMRDLSDEGALVVLCADVRLGEEIYLAFQPPRTRRWIDACARVVRIEEGRRDGDHGPAVGLRFESIDAPDLAFLRGALAAIPPTIPRRHTRVDYAATIASILAI